MYLIKTYKEPKNCYLKFFYEIPASIGLEFILIANLVEVTVKS